MPRRTTYLAAALLTATQCAAFTAPVTMGLKPPSSKRRRWRRAGTAAAGAAVGLLTPLKAGARALVSNEVIKAAAEARAACKPGSIRDRIITDHITLLTTTLRTSELARYKAIWNLVGGTLVFSVVFGLYVKWSTKTAERRLREAEIETFGEYRAASTIVADRDDDEDDDDDDDDDDDE